MSKRIYLEKILNIINKEYNKNTLPKINFYLFRNVMNAANRYVSDDLINHYGINQNSNEFYYLIRKWCRDNYGDGNLPIPGDTIRMIKMYDDPDPIKEGEIGRVIGIDTIDFFGEDHLRVEWENGRRLNVIVGVDEFERIKEGN